MRPHLEYCDLFLEASLQKDEVVTGEMPGEQKTIKRYRKSKLPEHGKISPENN